MGTSFSVTVLFCGTLQFCEDNGFLLLFYVFGPANKQLSAAFFLRFLLTKRREKILVFSARSADNWPPIIFLHFLGAKHREEMLGHSFLREAPKETLRCSELEFVFCICFGFYSFLLSAIFPFYGAGRENVFFTAPTFVYGTIAVLCSFTINNT